MHKLECSQWFQQRFTKFSLKHLVGLAMGTVVFRSWAREAATVLHLQSFKKRMVQISQEFNLAPLSLYQQLER
jgi:hypothetical protein